VRREPLIVLVHLPHAALDDPLREAMVECAGSAELANEAGILVWVFREA